jgi:hypothetical protein
MEGRVVVTQQPDGWWRWRFEPASPEGDTLVSAEAYPERDEAVGSAREAYPSHYPVVEDPQVPKHRLRGLIRRAATAALVVGVVVAAAKSGNRSRVHE